MLYKEINIDSYFPIDLKVEEEITNDLKKFNSKFIDEVFNDGDTIKNILQKNYKYIKNELDSLIKSISSKFILEKLCEEYYKTVLLQVKNKVESYKFFYGNNYKYRQQFYRRDLKYIIENICFYESNYSITQINNKTFTKIIILSEELMRICGDLDLLNIFPRHSTLTLNHNKSHQECVDFYFLKTPSSKIIEDIDPEFYNDVDLNSDIKSPRVFDEDIKNNCLIFFKNIYGVSFKNLEELFITYIKKNKKFCCFDKKVFFNVLHEQLGLKKGNEENFINKFLIDSSSYKNDIFNPKRDNRLYKRLFFIYHEKIYFIPTMAIENLNIIKQSFYFNNPPFFPISNTDLSNLTNINNQVGKSFENLTKNILESFELCVYQNIKKCSINNKITQLNSNGGEIDIIAFDFKRKICYFLECKMLNFSTEPRFYLDDYNKFFAKEKGYYYKFKKKIDFFKSNQKEIINFLTNISDINFSVEYKFITFYPCICKYVLENYENNIHNIELLTLYDLKKYLKNREE